MLTPFPDGNSNALQFKPYPGCGYRHDQLPSLREMFFVCGDLQTRAFVLTRVTP